MSDAAETAIAAHRSRGRFVDVSGFRCFALDRGSGETVVCHHGVPVSSFVYRRLAEALQARGLRVVCPDYPGLGLSERPDDFDYSWSGLAHWTEAATDSLDVERCHLVVHDIGGPVGLRWAVRNPDRVASVTILDTLLDVEGFTKPWSMRAFGVPVLGELAVRSLHPVGWRLLLRRIGMASPISDTELDAHLQLLRRDDGARAFLQIMRGFQTTAAYETELAAGLDPGIRRFPVQLVWGHADPALGTERRQAAERLTGVRADIVTGKHFVQEDSPGPIADRITALVASMR